jgi:branched-chain amino acid transport system substrate-binding protein
MHNLTKSTVAATLERIAFVMGIAIATFTVNLFAQTSNSPTPTLTSAAFPTIKLAMIESMSGPFANTGEAVQRNLQWAIERVNARGGVKFAGAGAGTGAARLLELRTYDSKSQTDGALSTLRAALDDGAQIILQGNSSSIAAALIDAVNKHNDRTPGQRVVFLNYSAVDPILTNEKCSPWHFRFDAHADMRMTALMEVFKDDRATQSVYLIGQDYSFGQAVLREAKRQIALVRPDVRIAAEELHPLGRIKDFSGYALKIKNSGSQAVITGNFGNDLTLLIRAAREIGFEGKFYTFYGNALGAPAAIGEAGIGKVIAVADWLPNVGSKESDVFYTSFRQRFPRPADDYVHMRMQLMIEALAQAAAGSPLTTTTVDGVLIDRLDAKAIAEKLSRVDITFAGQRGVMRETDHQFQQALVVGLMDKVGTPGVKFDVEGSGFGFRVIKTISRGQAALPSSCKMGVR